MKIKDLDNFITESYQADIKRQLRDALVSLKIQGENKLSTLAVLKDFASRGIKISIEELINLLQDDPMIQDVNREEIIFKTDAPDPLSNDEKRKETEEEMKYNVKKMSKRALKKRMH